MTTTGPGPMTYRDAVHNFDHANLAAAPAYAPLRQALSDLANQAPPMGIAAFLDAARDMAATAPYADTCDPCRKYHEDCRLWWPHAAAVEAGWLTGTYRCERGHRWTCGYAVAFADDGLGL